VVTPLDDFRTLGLLDDQDFSNNDFTGEAIDWFHYFGEQQVEEDAVRQSGLEEAVRIPQDVPQPPSNPMEPLSIPEEFAGGSMRDNTGIGSGSDPLRNPRPLTAADLHLQLEKEQEAVVSYPIYLLTTDSFQC
jgi:hypothetical protein